MIKLKNQYQGTGLAWYALVSYAPEMREQVYQWLDGHQCEPLYLTSPLESLLAQSPLLIALKYGSDDSLMARLPPERTLFFSAPATVDFQQVSTQLRWRMLVYFSGKLRGLLHYYHPQVASCFFSAADQEVTSQWLGIFCSVVFLRQSLREPACWTETGDFTSTPDMSVWHLHSSQEEALNRFYEEREVLAWAQANQTVPDWSVQIAVTRFCADWKIDQQLLIDRLRDLADKTGQPLSLHQYDPEKFARLTMDAKVSHIESMILREHQHD
ncbi:hypothetical protein VA7868_01447 [Vibrio aerogenes CECT 7868]|uniref:DUF4123 domain-containing protein n=1 Tax=Vibrio aerogenes CECT 7868 TaxID=1216006 RepID=A0A1M5Y203_9VIBR|nr:DUF4123 domain-containing protein [Vibrio aerogenes]SHI06115.1 hypothetical protein VA7868_01447 [Vibrio aerogenes CECT 7868]